MTLQEMLVYIESFDFTASINIQSGLSSVKHTLEYDTSLRQLIDLLHSSPDATQETYNRFKKLLNANDEPQYRHPHDAALTGYLYILSHTDERLAKLAIDIIVWTPNLWWARRLAKELRQSATEKNGTD